MCVQVPPPVGALAYVLDEVSTPFSVTDSFSMVGADADPTDVRVRVVVSINPDGVANVAFAGNAPTEYVRHVPRKWDPAHKTRLR